MRDTGHKGLHKRTEDLPDRQCQAQQILSKNFTASVISDAPEFTQLTSQPAHKAGSLLTHPLWAVHDFPLAHLPFTLLDTLSQKNEVT